MKYTIPTLTVIFFLLSTTNMQAQDSAWARDYSIGIYNQYDLQNSSANGITTHRFLQDAFRKEVKPLMGEKAGNITYGFYSFTVTFLNMLWAHEFGHSLRAKQVGGEFKIHNASIPIPYTTMHLPPDISYEDEALSVTGGFEVNYLTVRSLQREFITQNGLYNEDLSYSFANRIFYPLYTFLIVPTNPKEKEVWINTAGDPVHCVLPVFKNYSNNQVFVADNKVNPELVDFYNQSQLFGLFFNMREPQF